MTEKRGDVAVVDLENTRGSPVAYRLVTRVWAVPVRSQWLRLAATMEMPLRASERQSGWSEKQSRVGSAAPQPPVKTSALSIWFVATIYLDSSICLACAALGRNHLQVIGNALSSVRTDGLVLWHAACSIPQRRGGAHGSSTYGQERAPARTPAHFRIRCVTGRRRGFFVCRPKARTPAHFRIRRITDRRRGLFVCRPKRTSAGPPAHFRIGCITDRRRGLFVCRPKRTPARTPAIGPIRCRPGVTGE
jgi:hypothetical protein